MSLVQAVEQMEEEIDKLKRERDEAVALVEVMRSKMQQAYYCECGKCKDCNRAMRDALSITPSAALREIRARTLEDAANAAYENFALHTSHMLVEMATAVRKDEKPLPCNLTCEHKGNGGMCGQCFD